MPPSGSGTARGRAQQGPRCIQPHQSILYRPISYWMLETIAGGGPASLLCTTNHDHSISLVGSKLGAAPSSPFGFKAKAKSCAVCLLLLMQLSKRKAPQVRARLLSAHDQTHLGVSHIALPCHLARRADDYSCSSQRLNALGHIVHAVVDQSCLYPHQLVNGLQNNTASRQLSSVYVSLFTWLRASRRNQGLHKNNKRATVRQTKLDPKCTA